MKEGKTKRKLLSLLCAGTLVLTGASVWEGAATTAPRGALPAEGNYAATNSFPKNTVVDVTNLETGETIQAVVSAGLDTPGLLATLSEEAAKSLGLQTRSIGRIRMTQPSDPIAFSRFTEGRTGSGDPDYDPEAMIETDDEEYDSGEASGLGFTPPSQDSSAESPPAFSGAEDSDIVDIPSEEEPWFLEDRERTLAEEEEDDSPERTLYPQWARGGSRTPSSQESPRVTQPPLPPPPRTPRPRVTEPSVDLPSQTPAPDTTEVPAAPPPQTPAPGIAGSPTSPSSPDQESTQRSTQTQGNSSWATAWVTVPQVSVPPPAPSTYNYSLVPAEQRPPAAPVYTIPPEFMVGPIRQVLPETGPVVLDESLFVESIEDMRKRRGSLTSIPREPVVSTPSDEVLILKESALPKASVSKAVVESSGKFSIPVIEELEKGGYYLQLGAYSKPEILESSVGRVGRQYPLSVQPAGSPDRPIYRLLLGPVNLGESGALLKRFKSSGYRDAFVRRNY